MYNFGFLQLGIVCEKSFVKTSFFDKILSSMAVILVFIIGIKKNHRLNIKALLVFISAVPSVKKNISDFPPL
jgi:hypothetical protein